MKELPGNLGIPSALDRKGTCTFIFSYTPPSTLHTLQRGKRIPNPVQSQKKAAVISIMNWASKHQGVIQWQVIYVELYMTQWGLERKQSHSIGSHDV